VTANTSGSDLSTLLKNLTKSASGLISSLSSPSDLPPIQDDLLKLSILAALSSVSMTGNDLAEHIKLTSAGRLSPTLNQIFPILNDLTEAKLLAQSVTEELKIFSITKGGKKWLAEHTLETSSQNSVKPQFELSKSLNAKRKLGRASLRLGQAIAAVATLDDSESVDEAAKVVEKAAKKLFGMVAEND